MYFKIMIISDCYRHRYIALPIVTGNAYPVEPHHLGNRNFMQLGAQAPTAEVLVLF